jgi:hypothetical protein
MRCRDRRASVSRLCIPYLIRKCILSDAVRTIDASVEQDGSSHYALYSSQSIADSTKLSKTHTSFAKRLTPQFPSLSGPAPNQTLKRVRVVADDFLKNVYAVERVYAVAVRLRSGRNGQHAFFRASTPARSLKHISRLAKKAIAKLQIPRGVRIKYHVIAKFDCRKNVSFKDFYPVVGVELDKTIMVA